jgi:hypothetical protein
MSRPAFRLITRLTVLLIFLASAAATAQETAPDFAIEYSGAPNAIVIEYDIESAAQVTGDTGEPLLRVYGDGRVLVYRPGPGAPGGGRFEMKLGEAEVATLLNALHENGAITYDAKAVRDKLHDAKVARANAARAGLGELHERSDVELSVFRIRLESYRPDAAAEVQTDVQKDIRCVDLQREADDNPEIGELRGMAIVEDQLKALASDGRLRNVGGGQ